MRKANLPFRSFALLVFCCIATVATQAQQPLRTWVASTGIDTGTCLRTAPCRTFEYALTQTLVGGEINVVDRADYTGPVGTVVINKAVTIDALGSGATLTAQNFNNAIRVEAGMQDTVIIRNLSITGFQESVTSNPGDSGISYVSGGALVIQNCDIHSFRGAGISAQVRSNPTGAPIRNAHLAISDVKLYNNYGYGIYLDGRDGQPLDFALDNVRTEANGVPFGNGVGIAVFAFNGNVRGVVRDSIIAGNQTGIHVGGNAGRQSRLHVEDSSISTNSVGIQVGFTGGGDNIVWISDNVIQFNQAIGLTFSGGQVISFGDNKIGPGQGSPTSTMPRQ